MVRVSRHIPAVVALVLLVAATSGCQQQQQATGAAFGWKPLFGDLAKDTSPVVAQVGDVEITQADLEYFIDEQPERLKGDFAGPEGERVALRRMVQQALMVMGAVDRKLYNDKDVARSLVMQRRLTLDKAMLQYGLLRGAEPTEAQQREFYEKNNALYRQEGMVRVRHIECASKEEAERAYRRLQGRGANDDWVNACSEFSRNEESKKESGELGWMGKGTIVPNVDAGTLFSAAVFDLPIGVNPPLEVAGRWHVVEITHREYERASTFEEARDAVKKAMMPGFQDAIVKSYLKEARAKYGVTLKGRFVPGQGMTPPQLFERAMLNPDIMRRIDILAMIADDFPESDRADDALFMAANTAIENLSDLSIGQAYLERLIDAYPQSDLIDDAKFILENLYNPKFRQPTSIEDIRR